MYTPTSDARPIDPIISRLRPRTVAELLDQAFRLYRKHFLTFIAIIAVVHVPLQAAQQLLQAAILGDVYSIAYDPYAGESGTIGGRTTNEFFTYMMVVYGAIILVSVAYWLLQALSQGALTAEVANSHLDKEVSFGDAYRQMFRRFGSLLGVIFLQLLIGIAIFIPVILMFGLAIAAGIGGGTGSDVGGAFFGLFCFAFLLIIPLGILLLYVSMRLLVVTPAVMVEGLRPVEALRRSWGLVQGYWWRTFGLQLVLGILGYVVQMGPAALISGIMAAISPRDFVAQTTVSGLVTIATTLIYIPIQLVAVTLYYFDLRVRKEGYDLEMAVQQRYATVPAVQPVPGYAGYPQQQPYAYGQQPYPQYGQYPQQPPPYAQPTLGQSAPEQPQPQYGGDYPPQAPPLTVEGQPARVEGGTVTPPVEPMPPSATEPPAYTLDFGYSTAPPPDWLSGQSEDKPEGEREA